MKLRNLLALLVCAFVMACAPAAAQVALSPAAVQQFFDNNGKPLAGGLLYTYAAGTSTPQATYTDGTGTVANANPVVLDSAGRAAIWLSAASYKFVLKTSGGVTLWSADNVSDLALAGKIAVSVRTYGAKGDGVTDDTSAIAAACTAAGTGTLQFPAATYKVTTGNITTCSAGVTILGNGSTLDVTSANSNIFSFNVGGSAPTNSTPTTTIQGFRVLATAANTSTVFVRADRLPGFTIRDIAMTGGQLARIEGEGYHSLIDNCTLVAFPGYGVQFGNNFSYSTVPTGSLVRHLSCLSGTVQASTCVEVQGGLIEVSDIYSSVVGTAIHVNSTASQQANVDVRNGLIVQGGFSTSRGLSIDSLVSPLLVTSMRGVTFFFSDAGANTDIGIDINAVATVNVQAQVYENNGSQTLASFVRLNTTGAVNLTGSTFYQASGATTLNIFDLSNASGLLTASTIGGLTFNINGTVNFVRPSPSGSITSTVVSSNNFNLVTNFLAMSTGTLLTANNFIGTIPGTTTPTMALSGATLTGNYFVANPASTISPKATNCSNNINYACN